MRFTVGLECVLNYMWKIVTVLNRNPQTHEVHKHSMCLSLSILVYLINFLQCLVLTKTVLVGLGFLCTIVLASLAC